MTSIKAGKTSLTDPILACYKLKQYLLGPWLDELNVPPYIKVKSREIFASRKSYRQLYSPLTGEVDTAWLLGWPVVGSQLLSFLATTIFSPTANEEYVLRRAMKEASVVEEILALKPFCDSIAALKMEIKRTVTVDEGAGNVATESEPIIEDFDSGGEDEEDVEGTSHSLKETAGRWMSHMSTFMTEPQSFTDMKELIVQCPLTNMKGKVRNHVLILVDTNVYGETDVQPRTRVCPIPKTFWNKTLKGAWTGRAKAGGSDSDNPRHMNDYEIWMMWDSGKDRKRMFKQQLLLHGNDPQAKDRKMSVRDVTMWVNEESWKLN